MVLLRQLLQGHAKLLLLLQGLVSQDMRRSLGHMSFNFLLPTLTFVNIAPQVDAQELRHWWPAAINIILRWASSLLSPARSHVAHMRVHWQALEPDVHQAKLQNYQDSIGADCLSVRNTYMRGLLAWP